jgi:hypothetical protein
MVVLTVALMLIAQEQARHDLAQWYPETPHHYQPPAMSLAFAINLPAYFVFEPMELTLNRFLRPPIYVHWILGVVVTALLWYLVGLWFDRRLGLGGPRAPLLKKVPRLLLWPVALLFGAMWLYSVNPGTFFWVFLRGSIYKLAYWPWLAFAAVVLFEKWRPWQRLSSLKAQH